MHIIQGSNIVFHALTFARSRGRCLKRRPEAGGRRPRFSTPPKGPGECYEGRAKSSVTKRLPGGLLYRRSKAVVPVLVLLFVALWFILWGNLLYVFLCVILFLCFSVLVVLQLPRLGKREQILVLFVRLFGLCLFWFVGFLFLLGSGKGCGLWLWHSLDFSLTFFS